MNSTITKSDSKSICPRDVSITTSTAFIQNKGFWLTGIEDFTLSLNEEPNKATKHDKTFRVQPWQVEAI